MKYITTTTTTPVRYLYGGQFISTSIWTHAEREIDSFELIIGVSKTLYIYQEGIEYEVNRGDVLLVLPDVRHGGYKECLPGTSFYWFHFKLQEETEFINNHTLNKEILRLKTTPYTAGRESKMYLPLSSKPKKMERLSILANQLLDVDNSFFTNKNGVDYLMTTLLIELSEQTLSDLYVDHDKSKKENVISSILEWTRINAAMNDISVMTIAEHFKYNRDYLSRMFKQGTGMNLQEYIHLIKISKAKDLLTRTEQSVKDISNAVGIIDEKYFMRLFKSYEKLTPSEYRKAYFRTYLNND
ncbi:AraC family transcriptional regulator [Bacillus solitudinis]|uniref:AraC family transcriptional regulator n=1 Tax=Bacillus solitudinis TaxID=2014074 RepID=UPI000C234BCF|nr:AraC family transcriptional regulator [Bacillus solitudinis]